MLQFHPDVRPGDAFLHNSPYHGNTHAADHTILVPVFDDAGVHRFTVLAKAHQADCGNSLPTTYMGTARDVYQEGALIFPAVRVQQDYRDNHDIINMCMMRIRVPEPVARRLSRAWSARRGSASARSSGWARSSAGPPSTGHARHWFDYQRAPHD